MTNTNSKTITQNIIKHFVPLWTQNILASDEWDAELKKYLRPDFLNFYSSHKNSNHVNSYNGKILFDFVILNLLDAPKDAKDFILHFNNLNGGGVLISEIDPDLWNGNSISKLCDSLGADLIYLGAAQKLGEIFNQKKDFLKIVVLQKHFYKSDKKKISFILPINDIQKSHPRILEWLKFFKQNEILSVVELVLVFDGLHDALPLWSELQGLDIEQGLQMIRHYDKFGASACLQSAIVFARGNFILWDNYPIICSEFFNMLSLFPLKKIEHPFIVMTNSIKSDEVSSKFIKLNKLIPFVLCNQKAAVVLSDPKITDDIQEPKNMLKYLKKAKTEIIYTNLNEY